MAGGGQPGPLITFHAPGGRTFQRIFRDASLAETKEAVRQKLKIPVSEEISLARIQDGTRIDLDDDDDFEAFRIATRTKATVDVSVGIGSSSSFPGPSAYQAQPTDSLSRSLFQPESASAVTSTRKRKRGKSSMGPPHGGAPSPCTSQMSGTQVKRHCVTVPMDQSDRSYEQLHTSANGAGIFYSEAEQPRKRRKKSKFPDISVRSSMDRFASYLPPGYVPPTPDSLAPGPSPHTTSASLQVESRAKPTIVSPATESQASHDLPKKKRKRRIMLDPDAGIAPTASSSCVDPVLPPPEARDSVVAMKANEPAVRTSEPPSERPHIEPPAQPQTAPAEVKKHKTKKVPLETGEITAMAQPSSKPPTDDVVKGEGDRPYGMKKGKKEETKTVGSRFDESIIAQTDAAGQQAEEDSITNPAKRSKKSKKRMEAVEQTDAQDVAEAIPEAPGVDNATLEAAPHKSKSKEKGKGVHKKATNPGDTALAGTENYVDREKAVADAMAAIMARYNKSSKLDKVATVSDVSGSLPSQAIGSDAREDPGLAPVAGPSTVNPESTSKDKRKRKEASIAEGGNATADPVTTTTDSVATTKSKSKKRKGEGPAADATNTKPQSTRTDADRLAMFDAVRAASRASVSRHQAATPVPPPVWIPEPDATQEATEAPGKTKKPRKEKTVKAKPASEPADSADAVAAEGEVVPDSPASTSVTAVETEQPKRRRKRDGKTDKASPVDAVEPAQNDIEMAEPTASDPVLVLASAIAEESTEKPSEVMGPATPHAPGLSDPSRTSSRPASASRLLQGAQNSSPLRPPVGSDVDEVTVEGRGEGSSDESSSSDEDSEEEPEPDLSHVDVEALLRGPTPKKSILQELPSDSGEEDSDDNTQSEAADDDEEEMKLDKKYRRMSKRFAREGSSSTEELEPDAAADEEEEVRATFMDVDHQEPREGQAHAKDTPTVVPAVRNFASAEDGALVPGASDSTEAPTGQQTRSAPPEVSMDVASRPVSPTVSMMEEDHHKDYEGHASAQLPGQDQGQGSQQALQSGRSSSGCLRCASQEENGSAGAPEHPPDTSPLGSDASNTSSRRKSSPRFALRRTQGDDTADPIGLADDLIVPESPGMDEVDPNEQEPTTPQRASARQQSTPPPLPVSRPGTVKRMKDRAGKTGTPQPVRASELPMVPLDIPTLSELEDEDEDPPAPSPRIAGKRVSSATAMPPPPDTAPAAEPAPKRRGRPPIPQEEKDRRMAEKKAERERVAAERKAKREADKAVKEAEKTEKARIRLEQAAAKKGGKGAKGGKAAMNPVADVESEDEAEHTSVAAHEPAPTATKTRLRQATTAKEGGKGAKGSKAVVKSIPLMDAEAEDAQKTAAANELAHMEETPTAAGQSQRPGWTTLMQTPQTQEGSFAEGESMMVDELRSSSPAHSSPLAIGTGNPRPAQRGTGVKQPLLGSSQMDPDAQTASQLHSVVQSSDPLFLPSSSQVPYTPFAVTQPLARRAASPAASSSGSSRSDTEHIAQTGSQRVQRHSRPWTRNAPFSRLSDIASQAPFPRLSDIASRATFTPNRLVDITPIAKKDAALSVAKSAAEQAHAEDDEDDDSDEDDDEDEEEQGNKKSHIPHDRRAGAGVQKKRVSGLASFFK